LNHITLLRPPDGNPPPLPSFPYTTLFRSQQQFWNSQAPVGRIGPQKVTQILRAGNIAKPNKYASPVMGSGESGPMDLGRAKRSRDRKSTRLNSSHVSISYAVFCLKKKKTQ